MHIHMNEFVPTHAEPQHTCTSVTCTHTYAYIQTYPHTYPQWYLFIHIQVENVKNTAIKWYSQTIHRIQTEFVEGSVSSNPTMGLNWPPVLFCTSYLALSLSLSLSLCLSLCVCVCVCVCVYMHVSMLRFSKPSYGVQLASATVMYCTTPPTHTNLCMCVCIYMCFVHVCVLHVSFSLMTSTGRRYCFLLHSMCMCTGHRQCHRKNECIRDMHMHAHMQHLLYAVKVSRFMHPYSCACI
jgi:hypothetical protein